MGKVYIAYTDGACSNNQDAQKRIGAWGAAVFTQIDGKTYKKDIAAAIPGATNNQMELQSVLETLKLVLAINKDPEMPEVKIVSDSQYVVKGVTMWLEGWKNNDWKTGTNVTIANKEMWQEMDVILKKVKYSFEKVVGDGNDKWNDYVDKMVRKLCGSKPKRK